MNNDIIYAPFGDNEFRNLDIVKWDNCKILKIQFIGPNCRNRLGQYKVYYNDTRYGYFIIGCKGSGVVLDGIKYMADDNGLIDIKSINTCIHNREITETLEKI